MLVDALSPEKLLRTARFINAIIKAKPSAAKGTYLKSAFMASTMSPGIAIDTKSLMN